MIIADLQCIEIFSHWTGFADPPSRAEKLVVVQQDERFLWHSSPNNQSGELSAEIVQQLLAVLTQPRVKKLDFTLFRFPARLMESHYDCFWTNDYPSLMIRLTFSRERILTIKTDVQQAFMLPLELYSSVTKQTIKNFNPRLSEALAALLPENFMHKSRLGGSGSFLKWDLKEYEEMGEEEFVKEYLTPVQNVNSAPWKKEEHDRVIDELLSVIDDTETPPEKAQAEREGKISERLLKTIPLQDVRDLLARGANPNIADEVGQTALMHAAYPPLNSRDKEKFRLLVNAGANLEARCRGVTGLHIACAGGEERSALIWVRAGANVNARTPEEATPLMLGSRWPNIVRLLLDAGANVNDFDEDFHNALVYNISKQYFFEAKRQLQAMVFLIEAGIDVNLRDNDGITPPTHALRMLEKAKLEEDVIAAFHNRPLTPERADIKMAQAIVNLIEKAGGVE